MDPLSVASSIAGLLSAATTVTKALAPYVAAARETPKVAIQVDSEIQNITIILSALHNLAQNLGSVPVNRTSLIQVDHVVAVLTDGVLIFSDLEATVKSPSSAGGSLGSTADLSLKLRLQWQWKESEINSLLARLQSFKSSTSLILNILQSDSAIRAEQSQTDLTNNVNLLLEASKDIAQRLRTLENNVDAKTVMSSRRSLAFSVRPDSHHAQDIKTISQPATSPSTLAGFDFEQDLQTSLAYRRAQRESMDFSFRSSVAWSNGLSTLSRLTLGDVSVLSAIALPICSAEISNAHHYTFGSREPPDAQTPLAPIMREKQVPATPVNSLLYECLEIAIQLSHTRSSDIFWKEGLYSSQEHPFDVLRRIFSGDNPYLTLVRDSHRDPAELDALLRSGDVGLLRVLHGIKPVLATNFAHATTPIEPSRIHGLIRKKRAYFVQSPSAYDVILENYLAQERFFFHQLEDLPDVEKGMNTLNLVVEETLTEIFRPLYEFMQIQLRFLLDIERNLLLPPQSQRWSKAFTDWSLNAELYAQLIVSETRAKWIIRTRHHWVNGTPGQLLGGGNKNPRRDCSLCNDIIDACSKLLSLPALAMSGHLEFLDRLEDHIDESNTARKADVGDSRAILLQMQDRISSFVEQADLSHELSNLRRDMKDSKSLNIDQFGKLLMYEATVEVQLFQPYIDPSIPESYAQCRMYTFERQIIFARIKSTPIQTPGVGENMGKQKGLRLKGEIFLCTVKAIARSEPNQNSTKASDCMCLVVYTDFNNDPLWLSRAFEIRFSTPSKMQRWTEEMWAAIQAPQPKQVHQHGLTEAHDATKVPVPDGLTDKSQRIVDRGYPVQVIRVPI